MMRLTRSSGPQCLPMHAPGGITNVAISGSRAVWTTTYGGRTRILAASITDCQEWVVARPEAEHVAALAGVGVVPASWRGVAVGRVQSGVVTLSAYDSRIAALRSDGTVAITALGVGADKIESIPTRGEPAGTVRVGQAHAVALRDHVLAALSDHGTLDVYALANGRRLHSWPVPAERLLLSGAASPRCEQCEH
jgi:hypothetical protein